MKVLTAEQVRALDKRAIDEFRIPGMLLMESAALRVVDSITGRFPQASSPYTVIVCGKGNNGGDGFAVARHLSSRGYKVTVVLVADPNTLNGDAAANYELLKAFPVRVITVGDVDFEQLDKEFSGVSVIVDALFGTGFRGPVKGVAETVIKSINASGKRVLAVDIPSGVNADTGEVHGECVRADWTVTFAAAKIGLLLFPGAEYAGTVEVVSIGMPERILEDTEARCTWLTAGLVRQWFPVRTRARDANKGKYGHVALFAGGHGYLGAAQIAAEAAARMGAGLVTLATSEDALSALQTRLNAVIMTHALPSSQKGTIALSGLQQALELGAKCKTAAIGPGLAIARAEETAEFARSFIKEFQFPIVIDADAIVALSQLPDRGVELVASRTAPTILTPHPGEMAKLLGIDTKTVQSNRPEIALNAAREYNAVVVLKGDRSLIALPDGSWCINSTGNPGMATGGSGDALTGVIAGLLAQGLAAPQAAAAGVFLHGLAGDCAVKERGAREGLIATDLIESLGQACASMRASVDSTGVEGVIPLGKLARGILVAALVTASSQIAYAQAPGTPDPNAGFSRLFGLVFGLVVAGGAVWIILRLIRNRGEGLVELARKAGVDVPNLDEEIPLAATAASPAYKPKPPIEKIPEEATKPPAIPLSALAPAGSLARNNSYRSGGLRIVAEEGVASGSTFAISGEKLAIGRDGDNDVVLADSTVSRHHAVITRDADGTVTIEDGGSSNGVVINGERVDRATLSPGDQIKIGDNYFRLQGT